MWYCHRAIWMLLPFLLAALGYGCRGDGVSLHRVDDTLRFSTSAAVAVLETESFRLSLLTPTGEPLAEGEPGDLQYREGGHQFAAGRVIDSERSERTLRLAVETGGGTATVLLTWRSERTLEVEFRPPEGRAVTELSDAFRLAPDELIYGLLERVAPPRERPLADIPQASEFEPQEVGSLNRRGEVVELFVRPTIALYAPFYQSSAGYGLYVAGTTPGGFDVGASDPDVLRFRFQTGTTPESRSLRYYLFAGPSHATILDEYTALSGRPFLPPEWAFRHWRYRDELPVAEPARVDGVEINAAVADDLLMYEAHDIPPGVYLIDRPWSPGAFGFHRFTWDEARLPNAGDMLSILRDRGFRVVAWTAAWAVGDAPGDNGAEAVAAGFLAPGSDRIIDLTNRAAWDWWKEKHVEFSRRWDIAGWKLDRGEEFIPSEPTDVWADGRTGPDVHNAYVVLQLQLMHEAMREARGEDFVVIARAAYAGAQQYGIFWGGDTAGSTSFGTGPGTDLGLRSAIISLQRAGFTGFPIWGSDTGGYYQFKDREVFARWLQFSAFCPIMEIGGQGTHAPWDMPTEPRFDTEMIDIYRRYVRLHHDLIPYTVKHARIAAETGLPVARALAFDFPDDRQVLDRWDQFMYGDDILVAPVWRSGQRSREVYLPEGRWEDFWDRDHAFEGPTTITVEAPLDKIPVFVRAGADVPGR